MAQPITLSLNTLTGNDESKEFQGLPGVKNVRPGTSVSLCCPKCSALLGAHSETAGRGTAGRSRGPGDRTRASARGPLGSSAPTQGLLPEQTSPLSVSAGVTWAVLGGLHKVPDLAARSHGTGATRQRTATPGGTKGSRKAGLTRSGKNSQRKGNVLLPNP